MNASSDRPALRINSVAGLLASIPHLIGLTPTASLVLVGATGAGGVQVAFRYDLPDPPESWCPPTGRRLCSTGSIRPIRRPARPG
jgi:hypothetical protein